MKKHPKSLLAEKIAKQLREARERRRLAATDGSPAKFRKKPVVIEAIKWTGENLDAVLSFGCTGPSWAWGADYQIDRESKAVEIATLEGAMKASVGDWIIRGVQGEFYPCKPEIFGATYERVDQENTERSNREE